MIHTYKINMVIVRSCTLCLSDSILPSCRDEVVQVLPSNTVEEMDSNVERIVQWVQRVTGKS